MLGVLLASAMTSNPLFRRFSMSLVLVVAAGCGAGRATVAESSIDSNVSALWSAQEKHGATQALLSCVARAKHERRFLVKLAGNTVAALTHETLAGVKICATPRAGLLPLEVCTESQA